MSTFHQLFHRETAWWSDVVKTSDGKSHNYRATERRSTAGTSVRLAFRKYGSFEAYSEQAACKVFKDWYNEHIKTDEPSVRDQVREPSVRDGDRAK